MTVRRFLGSDTMLLATAFIVLFIGGGGRHAIGLVLKPMVEDFGWERGALGGAVALFLFVSAGFMFAAGHLADRFPLRLILAGGLAIGGVGIGLMSLVGEPWQVYLLYGVAFAIGNGIASITPVGVMVTRRFAHRAGIANSIAIAGMGLGQLVIISALAGVLVAAGWQSVFLWLGVATLAAVPFVLWAVRDGDHRGRPYPAAARPTEGLDIRGAMRTRYFWLLVAVYAVCGFQDFFVSTHVVAFALDQRVDTLLAGNLLAVMGLAGLAGVLAAGATSDRWGPLAATIVCFLLRVGVFALVLWTRETGAVAAFAVLFGLTFWVTAPLTVIFVRHAFGTRNLGAISGLVTMVHHVCGGIGAWLGAAVFDADGSYDAAFIVMLAGSALAVLLSLGMTRAPRFLPKV